MLKYKILKYQMQNTQMQNTQMFREPPCSDVQPNAQILKYQMLKYQMLEYQILKYKIPNTQMQNTQMFRELDQLAQMFSQAGSKDEREKVQFLSHPRYPFLKSNSIKNNYYIQDIRL